MGTLTISMWRNGETEDQRGELTCPKTHSKGSDSPLSKFFVLIFSQHIAGMVWEWRAAQFRCLFLGIIIYRGLLLDSKGKRKRNMPQTQAFCLALPDCLSCIGQMVYSLALTSVGLATHWEWSHTSSTAMHSLIHSPSFMAGKKQAYVSLRRIRDRRAHKCFWISSSCCWAAQFFPRRSSGGPEFVC